LSSSVSVIIPCYNYGHYLPGCVDSVLSQAGVDVDVLVIDDCSTDDSARVGRLLSSDPRVTFHGHDCNQGHLATYNEGLEWAAGDYTVLLSSDDLLVPGALQRACTVMDTHPEVGMTYGRSIYFESNDARPAPRVGLPTPEIWDGSDWIAQRCKTATSCISSPEVVVRTSLQRRLGGYRSDLPHAGDLEMWLRFAAHGRVAYLRGVDQAYYRVHPGSMMRTSFNAALSDLQQRKAAFDGMFSVHGAFVRDGDRLHDRADRALAREALWAACRAYDRRRLDEVSIADLEAFARSSYAGAISLPEYWGLRWRRRVGPTWCPRIQPILLSVVAHRIRDELWWRRWKLKGV
jgi:glycosyltransferase involved in cell wall biosynthesis